MHKVFYYRYIYGPQVICLKIINMGFYFIFLLLFAVLSIGSTGVNASVLAEENSVTLYSYNDNPAYNHLELFVSVLAVSSYGSIMYYDYEITDYDGMKHTVVLEVYYTNTLWNDITIPPVSAQRDFQSGGSYKGEFKIHNGEYGYYLFIFKNAGTEKCTMDYTLGMKKAPGEDLCCGMGSFMLVLLVLSTLMLVNQVHRKKGSS